MPNVLMPIRNLVTRVNAIGYTSFNPNTRRVVADRNPLRSGNAFHINRILRTNWGVWVMSGRGDWYQFTNSLFRCACQLCAGRDSRVMIWPQKPSPYWGPTLANNALYAARRVGGDNAYDRSHVYGIVTTSGLRPGL